MGAQPRIISILGKALSSKREEKKQQIKEPTPEGTGLTK